MRFHYFLLGLVLGIIITLFATGAFAAANPDQETPLLQPQSLKERVSPCVRYKIMVLAIRGPDGKQIPIMVAKVAVPCKGV